MNENTFHTEPATASWRTVGDDNAARRDFVKRHARQVHDWFDAEGAYVFDAGPPPGTRERLWHSMSLLSHGGAAELDLAQRIIQRTPIESNHFQPIVAAEVLMRFDAQLTDASRDHLLAMVRDHLVNTMEVRFGNAGFNNFSCMTSWFLAAASQLLPRYDWPDRFASVPEVYNARRLRAMALNALRAMAWLNEHETLSTEFNSPTYTPISLHALACIVELCHDDALRELALELELSLWRETLSFHHRGLMLPCGPYSRAYRVDVLGQSSLWRLLLAIRELAPQAGAETMLDPQRADLVFHHTGDVPFGWAQPAWVTCGEYHLPADEPQPQRDQHYPRRCELPLRWEARGKINEAGRILSVQGDAVPAGAGHVVQEQHQNWAVGYRTRTNYGQTFPLHMHYALEQPVRDMAHVRSVLAGVMFHGLPDAPPAWTHDWQQRQVEPDNFNHVGEVRVNAADERQWRFDAEALESLAGLSTSECSLNLLIPEHFHGVERVILDGDTWDGKSLQHRTDQSTLRIEDRGFVYELCYTAEHARTIELTRWCRFIRFSLIFHRGEPITPTTDQLRQWQAQAWLTLQHVPAEPAPIAAAAGGGKDQQQA